jgi:hypothetical protein
MGELLTSGYQTIRDFANSSNTTPNSWDYIELYDDSQNAVTRVSITGDARCQWLDVDGDSVLKVEFDVTGSDGDIPLPTTIQYTALFNDTSANNGKQITALEQFAQATLNQSGDNVTITHTVNIPQ